MNGNDNIRILTSESEINEALNKVNESRGFSPSNGQSLKVTGIAVRNWEDREKKTRTSVYFRCDVTLASGQTLKDQDINFAVLCKRLPAGDDRAKFLADYPVMTQYQGNGQSIWALIKDQTLKVSESANTYAFKRWDKDGNELPEIQRKALVFEIA